MQDIEGYLKKHGPPDAPKDWLFVDIPEKIPDKIFERDKRFWQEGVTDPNAWKGTIYNGWGISHEYEDIEDIPDDVKHERYSVPRFSDLFGTEDQLTPERRAQAYHYGAIKVKGAWVYSYWRKSNCPAYKYFYHHLYQGPKKQRPQHLWPHCEAA